MILPNAFPGVGQNNTPVEKQFTKAGINGTLISVILDASGSMASCYNATIEGFNEFLNGQKNAKDAGQAYISLVQFDAPMVLKTYTNLPVEVAPKLSSENYKPNGGTNLMDAIGETLLSIDNILSTKSSEERPAVLVLIMTDGHENASRSYNKEMIKTMVKSAETAEWTFMFMGANVDAFTMGSTFGMNTNNSFNYSVANTLDTYAAMSSSTTAVRSAKLSGSTNNVLYAKSMISDELKSKMESK